MVSHSKAFCRLVIIAISVACLVFALSGCEDSDLPTQRESDCPRVPPPPLDTTAAGLLGITLRAETECKFRIDLGESDRLRWCNFVMQKRNAYVRMKIWINEDGKVTRIFDTRDGGKPAYLRELRNSVTDWVYRGGCLYGELRLMFIGAGSKLYVDRDSLMIVPGYEWCDIVRGLRLDAIWRGCDFNAVDSTFNW